LYQKAASFRTKHVKVGSMQLEMKLALFAGFVALEKTPVHVGVAVVLHSLPSCYVFHHKPATHSDSKPPPVPIQSRPLISIRLR
jgi:hypothetical protein